MSAASAPATRCRSVLIAANTSWYVHNFRASLIARLRERGHRVAVASPPDAYTARLFDLGVVRHHPLPALARRVSPREELALLRALRAVFRREPSDLCLTYTPRINCYAPLAAWPRRRPQIVRNVSGLGAAFGAGHTLAALVSGALYRSGRRSRWTFYQNAHDMRLGLARGFSPPARSSLLPGSGVDLARFRAEARPPPRRPRVLMAARLIPAKGFVDFLEAVRAFGPGRLDARLAGAFSGESGLGRRAFDALLAESGVEYLGHVDDVAPLLRAADCVVLPSTYAEGVPRILLEGAASGCVLIAYPNPGSEAIVRHGRNGWICDEATPAALGRAFDALVALTPERWQSMRAAARAEVEARFDERIVLDAYLALVEGSETP